MVRGRQADDVAAALRGRTRGVAREVLRGAPWQVVVFSLGMYLVVYGLRNAGLTDYLTALLERCATYGVWGAALGTGFITALLSSIMNNMPTVLIGALSIDRLEIGYTWYGKSWQRSHVNTSCKLLLMTHAFETLGAQLVGWRTDNYNFASQRAIERLGARKDGVLRHHAPRRDGTVRDTVMYSLAAGEWPEVKAHLQYQLAKPR